MGERKEKLHLDAEAEGSTKAGGEGVDEVETGAGILPRGGRERNSGNYGNFEIQRVSNRK